jgi:hypothetical protein
MVDRTDREAETRSEEERAKPWSPPQILPDPNPRAGWVHRYVRVKLLGEDDPVNASQRFREGWVPCKSEEYPEIMAKIPGMKRGNSNIEVGGLMLCRMPEEMYKQRQAYYDKLAQQQLDSVENNFMRESDPRMPLSKPERHTKVTFGRRR